MRATLFIGIVSVLGALLGCGLFDGDEDTEPTATKSDEQARVVCEQARECCVKLNTLQHHGTARCAELDAGAKCAFALKLARGVAREAGVSCP